MSKKVIVIIFFIIVLILAIGLTVYLLSEQQNVRSKAQVSTQQTCTPPAAPTNVKVNYPLDTGAQTDFSQASCTWDGVSGATSYNLKITEVDTNTTVKSQTIAGGTTSVTFSVTNGRTYKCDVSAINSCGATGATGSDSRLCQADVVPTNAPSATPVPTTPPGVTPSPIVVSTPVPTVIALTCGQVGCSATSPCIAGLTCITSTNGQAYCAYPVYSSACQQSGGVTACCSAPPAPPRPTLKPTGSMTTTLLLSAGGIGLVVLGGLLFLL